MRVFPAFLLILFLAAASLPAFGQSQALTENLARDAAYRVTASFPDTAFVGEEQRYPDTGSRELTDGVRAAAGAPHTDASWQGWAHQDRRVVTLDMGRGAAVSAVTVHLGLEPSLGIFLPETITVAVSEDGIRWSPPIRTFSPTNGDANVTPGMVAVPITVTLPKAATARYVQVQADVRVWVFVEEIEVRGSGPAAPGENDVRTLERIVRERRGLLRRERMEGWLPGGSDAAGGARHISLMYVSGAAQKGLGPDHYLPYVAYVDKKGDPADTLFDSFLFLPSVRAATGRSFADSRNPATLEDWTRFLDQIFTPDFQLAALDRATGQAASALKRPLREKVIIAIPFPAPRLPGFGKLPGTTNLLDFDASPAGYANRLAAVTWFRNEVQKRWVRARFEHLDLIGFYWFAEEVTPADRHLVRAAADQIHQNPAHRFFWIPYYQATGIRDWKENGFDAAMLQPNLSFSTIPAENSGERLQSAAQQAARYGLGLEIELHWTLTDPSRRAQYRAYLDWGKKLGYQKRALLSYYQSVDSLREASQSADPEIRALYDATYQFIKPTGQQ